MQKNNGACRVGAVVFSKDRAMQLDAALRSLWLHCPDIGKADVRVLYATSDSTSENQYARLKEAYPDVQFMREQDFKEQLLSAIAPYPFVMFMVDDNMFVGRFLLAQAMHALETHDDALAFSFRLGQNTTYCYSMDRMQRPPDFRPVGHGFVKFHWAFAEYEFGYPLEVSSSLYRTQDLFALMAELPFRNPNTLESHLAHQAHRFAALQGYAVSSATSLAFCIPVNVVQQVYRNRTGAGIGYSVQELSGLFEQGYRIDVNRYAGFTPGACHQEVELCFVK
jgi:hypothetical protein